MFFRGEAHQEKDWSEKQKLEYAIKLHEEMNENYNIICKLFLIVKDKGLKMVVENPATKPHHLTSYFPIGASLVDYDRRKRGDKQKKPTQYWFVGFEPKNNLIFEPIVPVEERRHVDSNNQTERSMIHPQYANRFIREFILDKENIC